MQEKGLKGQLGLNDIAGGTFTLSNIGVVSFKNCLLYLVLTHNNYYININRNGVYVPKKELETLVDIWWNLDDFLDWKIVMTVICTLCCVLITLHYTSLD